MLVDNEHIVDYYEGQTGEYAQGLEAVLSGVWISELRLKHLSGKEGLALRVSDTNNAASEYILKYGKMPLDSDFKGKTDEITRGMAKTAKNGNFGPLDLLFHSDGNRRFARLFVEYAHATKGKSQLQWSRGLKGDLDIETIRDEMACEGAETETDRLLAMVPAALWKYAANQGHLGQIMTIAHTGEEAKLADLLTKINARYEDQLPGLLLPEIGH
jgi:hypothetical protein